MTCLGTLLRTVEDLSAQLPGAVASDDNSDTYIRVPGGWRSTVGFTVYPSQAALKRWGPLTLTSQSPLEVCQRADPEGIRLVEGIHERLAAKPKRCSDPLCGSHWEYHYHGDECSGCACGGKA